MKKLSKITYHYSDGTNETIEAPPNFKKVDFRSGITQKQVKQLFDYDPSIGGLIWKKTGKKAGSQDHHGYRRVYIDGLTYREHHVVWLWHHGELPNCIIDHINRIKDDNRIENLRKSDPHLNNMNRSLMSNNTSGHTGVKLVGKKWYAEITINKKTSRLGSFTDKQKAILARKEAEKKYYGIE